MVFLKTVTVVMGLAGLINFNHSETIIPTTMSQCRGYLTYLSTINKPDDVSRMVEWISPDELKLTVNKGDYVVKLSKTCVEIPDSK